MTDPTGNADVVPLPLRIDRASFEEPTLLLGGDQWSLAAICLWRWVSATGGRAPPPPHGTRSGRVVTSEAAALPDAVWDLIGDSVLASVGQGRNCCTWVLQLPERTWSARFAASETVIPGRTCWRPCGRKDCGWGQQVASGITWRVEVTALGPYGVVPECAS